MTEELKKIPRPKWLDGLTHKDWMFDGYPIRGDRMIERWNALDWSKAYVDMGPSIAGNLGPYWHVPLVSDDETVHRLYPKFLSGKWIWVIRRAVEEAKDILERKRRAKKFLATYKRKKQ